MSGLVDSSWDVWIECLTVFMIFGHFHFCSHVLCSFLLVFISGYPTHFGQLECMKLIASPHFPEKRIGYLGLLLLLSEEADVLMLATNSLKNDMNSSNKFIAGLALCALGNLGTPDMSRDLATEVEKHLKSSNPYLRKKACLAMSRCLVKVPEMVEDFTEKFVTLLKDRSHGVLITVVQLMTQVMLLEGKQEEYSPTSPGPARTAFVKLVPTLVKMLRNLLSSGFSPEHDIGGISDPFLQVQILTLLRLLGTGDPDASDEMNDILAQVATNTETSKNAGNAILYECVQTIMSVESEDTLQTLAINILGRFLLNRDNNIRYVALNTLAQVVAVHHESAALQKHQNTIVDCLKDPDISIRQRALELIYHLVNASNVESLTAELLNYLVVCPKDHKGQICSRVLKVVDRFSPDERWKIDTLITMLTIAGKQCRRDVQSATIAYITRSDDDIRAYAVHKLLTAVRDDDGGQTGLNSVGIWCIGEYGDLLLKPYTYMDKSNEQPISFEAIEPQVIVHTIEELVQHPNCPDSITQRALTAYAKLSTRFSSHDDNASKLLEQLVRDYKGAQSIETQLRSCEYDVLMALSNNRKEALARMPAVDLEVMQRNQKLVDGFVSDKVEGKHVLSNGDAFTNGNNHDVQQNGGSLLDLDDIFGGGGGAAAVENENVSTDDASPSAGQAQSDVDLLSDIFSAPPVVAASGNSDSGFGLNTVAQSTAVPVDLFAPQPSQQQSTPVVSVTPNATPNPLDLFGPQPTALAPGPVISQNDTFSQKQSMPASTIPIVSTPSVDTVQVLDKDGLFLEFLCTKVSGVPQKSQVVAKFTNKTNGAIMGVNLQCAVPKYITMEMQPPTSTTIPSSMVASNVTQTIYVTNTMLGKKSLMMKVKVVFTVNGNKVEHLVTCSAFPSGY